MLARLQHQHTAPSLSLLGHQLALESVLTSSNMNCSCPAVEPEQVFPNIILHITLFVLAIFWPFMVVGVSMIGVRMKEDYLDALEVKRKARHVLQDAKKDAYVSCLQHQI